MSDQHATPEARQRSNVKIALGGLAIAVATLGLSFAAVPFYSLFCRVTGYGGTTQRVETYSDRVIDRKVTVRFDANVSGVPFDFQPVERDVTLKLGEAVQVAYRAVNRAAYPVTATATFNVQPALAGSYFNKIECFCFTETTLKPGESLDMPVVFYVDPDILEQQELKDIRTITLSYTFFPVEGADKPVAQAPADTSVKTNSIRE